MNQYLFKTYYARGVVLTTIHGLCHHSYKEDIITIIEMGRKWDLKYWSAYSGSHNRFDSWLHQ